MFRRNTGSPSLGALLTIRTNVMPTERAEPGATPRRFANGARRMLWVAAACSLALTATLLQRPAMAQGAMDIIDCKRLEDGRFDVMHDQQRIVCDGAETSAGALRREWQQTDRHRLAAKVQQSRLEAQANLDALQRKHGPKMRLDEAEARMLAELAKLRKPAARPPTTRDRLGAISQEVARLEQQLKSARTPEERSRIEARAKEVAGQLHAMGGSGDSYRYVFAKVCVIVDCLALFPFPHIDAVLAFSIVSPNGPIILTGKNFGSLEGTLWLNGTFGSREMIIDSWGDTGIGAFFPSAAAIGPIFDLNLTMQVESSDGLKGNHWPLQWIVDVKLLDQGSAKVHNCGKDGNVNSCNGELYVGAGCFSVSNMTSMILASKPPDPNCPCSAVGSHGNCWAAIGDDFGSDTYQIGPLRNAWTLLSLSFGDSLPKVDSCDHAVKPLGFQPGANQWAPEVHWCVTPNDQLFYWLWIYILGPRGFAH